jgi:hypothetical protein
MARFLDPGEGLERLRDSWYAIVEAVQARGGAVSALSVSSDAPRDLSELRAELRPVAPVPHNVTRLLALVTHARFEWRLDAVPNRQWASWGDAHWSVPDVIGAELHRRNWVDEVFNRPDDPYDAVWQESFGFMVLGNDDIIGVDASTGYVVYASHDDADAHGAVLGTTVVDFVRRWTQIGCPGPDGWSWEQDTGTEGIEVGGAGALRWLGWLTDPRSAGP